MKIKEMIHVLFLCCAVHHCVAQDTIVFQKGYTLLADIIQESETKIRYKKPDMLRSPVYLLEKRFVTAIQYQFPDSAAFLFKADTVLFEKELDVWVTHARNGQVSRGLLHDMNDTTLFLRKKSVLFEGRKKFSEEIFTFSYDRIQQIEFRRQKRVRQYAIWGGAVGFTVGTIVGLAIFKDTEPCDQGVIGGVDCDDSLSSPRSQVEKALLLGAGGLGAGVLTGGMIGAIRVKIPIGAQRDQFNAAVPRLQRMARLLEE